MTARRRTARYAAVATCLATVAGCAPSGPGHHVAHRLAKAYLAIAEPANDKLEQAENSYTFNCRTHLTGAEAALRSEAAIERGFDRQLATIRFPPSIEATATALISVNQIRIAFTLRQAKAGSINALLAFTGGHQAADAEVEAQVRAIRAELGLPPPASS